MKRSPHGLNAPGVKTQKVRKVYVGGQREEAALDGITAMIGTHFELLGATKPSGPAKEAYDRAGEAFYRRFPDHPNHWAWRYWRKASPWVMQLNAPTGDPKVKAGYSIYQSALLRTLKAWRAANPRALAVHPASVHWEPSWDLLQFDPDPVLQARNEFLHQHAAEFRAAPGGLWEALQEQYRAFFNDYYEYVPPDKRM